MSEPADTRLHRTPDGFDFDAAVRVLLLLAQNPDAADAITFHSPTALDYDGGETQFTADGAFITGVAALTGPAGTMPFGYTDIATQAVRARTQGMKAFLDFLAQRLVGHFANAGARYRPHRLIETHHMAPRDHWSALDQILFALTGLLIPDLDRHLTFDPRTILYYSGIFATWPRCAERLGLMLGDFLSMPVTIDPFHGGWLALDADQLTRLDSGSNLGRNYRLGLPQPTKRPCPDLPPLTGNDLAVAGVRVWDCARHFQIHIGPVDAEAFESLMPRGVILPRVIQLVRCYAGLGHEFDINVVVEGDQVPALRLGSAQAQLGWNTWLGGGKAPYRDEPRFRDSLPARLGQGQPC